MDYTSFPAFFFTCLILIGFTSARDFGYSPEDLLSEDRTVSLYESWLAKHNKAYTLAEEKEQRYKIFKDNLRYIDEVNQQNLSFWLGLNKFSDLSKDEFKSKYLRNIPTQPRGQGKKFRYENLTDLPESLDWRDKGAVTDVKDQGECGSCWAFTVTGVVESINEIVTGDLVSLSEQQLIDCTTDNNGCSGGSVTAGLYFVISNGGIDSEKDYSYEGSNGQCDNEKLSHKVASIDGFEYVDNNGDALVQAVANQPVIVGIDGGDDNFRNYDGGVLSGSCGTFINHALVIVGYGSDDGKDYVIGRNSWGSDWGDDGYVKLDRSIGGAGLCGIFQQMVYPTKGN